MLFKFIFDFYESFNDINKINKEIIKKTRYNILANFFKISTKYLDLQDPVIKEIYNKSKMYKASISKPVKIPTIKQLIAHKKDEIFIEYCKRKKIDTFHKFSAYTFENNTLKPELKSFCFTLEKELRHLEEKLRVELENPAFCFYVKSLIIFGEAETQINTVSLKQYIEDVSFRISDVQRFASKLKQAEPFPLEKSHYRNKFKELLQNTNY